MKKMCLFFLSCATLLAEPLYFDWLGRPIPMTTRTICGTDDLVDVKDQNDIIKKFSKAIGLLEGLFSMCTGTLVGPDLFLTARHCYSECSELSVTFDYYGREPQKFPCREILEKGAQVDNQDYMLLRLEGSPGVDRGWFDLSDRELKPKETLLMIHHPEGGPMKASIRDCFFEKEIDGILHHSCDTNPGSSGAAIIAPDYEVPERSRVVGVHAFGGCDAASTTFNAGPAIRHLVTVSQRIRDLVK